VIFVNSTIPASWHSGQFHSVSLIHCPDESDTIQRVLFSIPAVPFKEPLPAYSLSVLSVST
jgi:hypothetical protein